MGLTIDNEQDVCIGRTTGLASLHIDAGSKEAGLIIEGTNAGALTSLSPNTTYLYYHPGRGALRFRSLGNTGNEWEGGNLGSNSFACGTFVTAAGFNSFAVGLGTRALADYSVAIGERIEVSGRNSFGIALNDQAGTTVTRNNTLAIMGGEVGIGTINPSRGKVEIVGSLSRNPYTAFFRTTQTTSFTTASATNKNISLYATSAIAANEFHAHSDRRIKNVIGISNAQDDLQTLMGIEITDYTYIDTLAKGTDVQKKVIAQQVADVYPQAVTSNMSEVVPDIMQIAELNDGQLTLENVEVKVGEMLLLIFENSEELVEVTAVSGSTISVNSDETGRVFVYGREVDDFHVVDYDALSTLNISATQALARKLLQTQHALETLKTNVEARLEALEAAAPVRATAKR